MTDKELKRLSRAELLELLLEQVEENEQLRSEISDLREQLNDRIIKINEAGSIAEAALRLNGVFEAAEAAARQYVDSLKELEKTTINRVLEKADTQ